jgi:hypothetical protein
MSRTLTITLDDAVYDGLCRNVPPEQVNQFIENLMRPLVSYPSLEDGYRAMARDEAQEAEAVAWINGLIGDLADETR